MPGSQAQMPGGEEDSKGARETAAEEGEKGEEEERSSTRRLWGRNFDPADLDELETAKAAVTVNFPTCESAAIMALSCSHHFGPEVADKGDPCRDANVLLVRCIAASYCPREMEALVACIERQQPGRVADFTRPPPACMRRFSAVDHCLLANTDEALGFGA